MKKLAALLTAVLFSCSLCACGQQVLEKRNVATDSQSSEAPVGQTAPSDTGISLTAVRDKILSDLQITEYLEMDAGRLLNIYGINQEDLAQSACFTTMAGTFPHEVILVEAADEAAAQRIAEKLQHRLQEVQNQYRDYDAESYAMAELCAVETDGLIVSLFLSPDHEAMREILTASLSEN